MLFECKSSEERRGVQKAELNGTLIQRTTTEAPRYDMYYIGLDVHKKTISYCVKDVSGHIQQRGRSQQRVLSWITG